MIEVFGVWKRSCNINDDPPSHEKLSYMMNEMSHLESKHNLQQMTHKTSCYDRGDCIPFFSKLQPLGSLEVDAIKTSCHPWFSLE
jgi:hypothetical protein